MTNPISPQDRPRKTLILHIGDHKTGSTSIQNAFAAGRVSLQGREVLYPGNLDHNYLNRHVQAAARDKTPPKNQPGMPNLVQIVEQMAESPTDTCLLSGESFENIAPEELRAALDRLFLPRFPEMTLRIIVYIRPHAGRLLSTFSEQVKIGWYQGDLPGMFTRTLKSKRFFFAPRLRRWREVFGDQLLIRPMIRKELLNGSVVDDFVATAFDGQPFEIAAGPASNESLGLEDLMLIKYVHSHLGQTEKGARLGLGWEIAQNINAAKGDSKTTKLQIHKGLARRIRNTYLEDARTLDAEFFGNRGLFEADLGKAVETAAPKQQSVDPNDYFNPRELRDIALLAKTMAGMLGRDQMRWAFWFRARRAEMVQTPSP